MGKKGTKRKTRWRTLSITECPDEENSATNGVGKGGPGSRSSRGTVANNTTDMNVAGASSLDENLRYSATNASFVKRKPSSYFNRNTNTSPSNRRNDHRNSFNNQNSDNNYNYYQNKHNNTNNRGSSSSSVYSSRHPSSYRRRPFSQQNQNQQYGTNNTKYYSSYGAGRATSRAAYYRSTDNTTTMTTTTTRTLDNSNKDNADGIKPFNDDDYTRISTPRQDVVFKKGYLSQPKKYLSSTDTNTTSSAAASIISAEESMSATSVPSMSPEQCSSQTDSFDPDTAFMYSYMDQNGFICVNPYLPNNQFDQYGNQVYMMPYPYPPYGMSSTDDAASPTLSSGSGSDQNRSSVDSTENSSDLNNSEGCDKNPKSPTENGDDEPLSDEDINSNPKEKKETEEKNPKDPEKSGEEKDSTEENATATTVNPYVYDYGYPYFQPVFYPFMYPPEYIPVEGVDCDDNVASKEICDVGVEEQNKTRFKRRRRPTNEANSTGVSTTTTDYSEDGLSDDDDVEVTITPTDTKETVAIQKETPIDNPEAGRIPETKKTDIVNSTLNGDVKEFVPRGNVKYVQQKLNVDVKEFIPRNYKPSNQDIVEDVLLPTLETSQSAKEDETEKLSENKVTSENSGSEEDKKVAVTNPITPMEGAKESKQQRNNNNKQKDRQFIKEKPIQSPIGNATFADKIKSNLADGFKDDTSGQVNRLKSSTISGRNNRNQNRKKSIGKSTTIPQPASPVNEEVKVTIKNESPNTPSYAQMLNNSSSGSSSTVAVVDETKPLIPSPSSSSTHSSSPKQSKAPTKEIMVKNFEPTREAIPVGGQSKTNADNTSADIWQTVKPRGKRGKLFKDVISPAEEEDNNTESRSIEKDNKFEMNGIKELEDIVVAESNVKDLVNNSTGNSSKKLLTNTETENIGKTEDIKNAEVATIKTSTPVSDKKKQQKQKNKKTPNKNKQTTTIPPMASNKKANKGFALIEPQFVSSSASSSASSSTEKTEKRKANTANHDVDSLLSDKHDDLTDNTDQQEDETDSAGDIYNSSITDQNLNFDQLYPLQRTSPLMGKGFRHSHLNMINGFDYKFKDSSLLIKEEEEMVLSVIKSLSTNHSGKSSSSDNESDENCNNQLNNGDSGLTSDSVEDFDDKTIIQSCPDIIEEVTEINNSSEMKAKTESYESDTVSDLSSDDCVEIKENPALNDRLDQEVVETTNIDVNLCKENEISRKTKNENVDIIRPEEIIDKKLVTTSMELEISTANACLEIDSSELKTLTNFESNTIPSNEIKNAPNYEIYSIPVEVIDMKPAIEGNNSIEISSREYVFIPLSRGNVKRKPRKEVEIFWDVEDVKPKINNENNEINSNLISVGENSTSFSNESDIDQKINKNKVPVVENFTSASSELDTEPKKKKTVTSTIISENEEINSEPIHPKKATDTSSITLENEEINSEPTKDLSQIGCESFELLNNSANDNLSAKVEHVKCTEKSNDVIESVGETLSKVIPPITLEKEQINSELAKDLSQVGCESLNNFPNDSLPANVEQMICSEKSNDRIESVGETSAKVISTITMENEDINREPIQDLSQVECESLNNSPNDNLSANVEHVKCTEKSIDVIESVNEISAKVTPTIILEKEQINCELAKDLSQVECESLNNSANDNLSANVEHAKCTEKSIDVIESVSETSAKDTPTITLKKEQINYELAKDLSQVGCESFESINNFPNDSLSAANVEQMICTEKSNDIIESVETSAKVNSTITMENENISREPAKDLSKVGSESFESSNNLPNGNLSADVEQIICTENCNDIIESIDDTITNVASTITMDSEDINSEPAKDLPQVGCESLPNSPNYRLSANVEQMKCIEKSDDKIENSDDIITDEKLQIINKTADQENHMNNTSEEIINEQKSNSNKIGEKSEETSITTEEEEDVTKSNNNLNLSSNSKDDITTNTFKPNSNDAITSLLDKNKKSMDKIITLNDNCENITKNAETMSYIESRGEYGKERGKSNTKVRRILKNLHNNNAAQVLNNISDIVTQKNELLNDKVTTATDDHCSKENIINCNQVNITSPSLSPSQCIVSNTSEILNQNDQLISTTINALSSSNMTENSFVAQKSDNSHKLNDNLINIDVKKTEMFNGSVSQSLLTNKEQENVRNSNLSNNETYCKDIACGSSKNDHHVRISDQNFIYNLANDHFPKYIQNDYIEHKVYELKLENNNVKEADISQLHDQIEEFAEKYVHQNKTNDLRKVNMHDIKDCIENKFEEHVSSDHVKDHIDNTDLVHDKFEEQIQKVVIEKVENIIKTSDCDEILELSEHQIKDNLSKHDEDNIFPQINKAETTPEQFVTSTFHKFDHSSDNDIISNRHTPLQLNSQYHQDTVNGTNLSAHETEPKDAKNSIITKNECSNEEAVPHIENQISSSIIYQKEDKSILLTPPLLLAAQIQSDNNCTITNNKNNNKANSAPGETNNKRASSLPPTKDSIKNTSCDIMPYSNNPIKQNSTENLTNNSASIKSDSKNFMSMPAPLKTPSSSSTSFSSSLRDVRNAENNHKFPLTQAVLQWLNEETKEKTPEPILRIPDDPILSTFIESSIKQQHTQPHNTIPPDDEYGGCNTIKLTGEEAEYENDSVSDESEIDEESKSIKNSKNLKSNPSHVSSVNRLNLHKRDKAHYNSHYDTSNNNTLMDNDSDYNSDSQQRNDDDKYTCERVAYQPSDNILKSTPKIQLTGSTSNNNNNNNQQIETINDLLDFWDDDFMKNPQKWLKTTTPESTNRCSISADRESTASSTNNLEPYESVYGKSIDYKRLFENKKEFLSNNIISFNDNKNKNINNETLNSNHNNINNIHQTSLNIDNFDNNNKLNDNCLKPPEVCCILM